MKLVLVLTPWTLIAQTNFNDFFTGETLRFDCLLSGNSKTSNVIAVGLKKEMNWAAPHKLNSSTKVLGNYRYSVKDQTSGQLLYSQGFSPLFQEWQSTAEAKLISKAFYQVIRFPFPRKEVILTIDLRNRDGKFEKIFESLIRPTDYFILQEKPAKVGYEQIIHSGDPAGKVDMVILAEGYREEEMGKFVGDVKRLTDSLFSVEPFSSYKDQFNVTALKTPSQDSGTDVPGKGIYANTLFNSTFYTFDIDRYLTASDMKSIHDHAAGIPYDILVVLVNTSAYGGGGFYNFLSVASADNQLSPQVFIHEFGHALVGLGDEYYNSKVAYEDYYNLKVEPWEPNLTTMVNFSSKWSSLIEKNIPVPTPRTDEYAKKTGVFEGGGYTGKGIYSPAQDCRMKSNTPREFCPVCRKAIVDAIQFYTK